MDTFTAQQRQQIGCGFEPLIQLRSVSLPPSGKLGFEGLNYDGTGDPTVCPGYTTALPEVREVARAYSWREIGELRSFTGGQPSEKLVEALDVFGREVARYERWAMTPAKDGGGRDVR